MNLTWLAYAGVMLTTAMGIIGEWTGGPWQDLWQILATLLILGLTLEGFLQRRIMLPITREVNEMGFLGEPLETKLLVHNPNSHPLALEIQQRFPHGLTGSEAITHHLVEGHQTAISRFTVIPQTLGILDWGPLYGRLRGPLGLAWWPRTISGKGSIRIVPARLQPQAFTVGLANHGQFSQQHQGHGKDFLWHRDYLHGDPIRAIDWKATARSRRPLVRVWTEEQRVDLMILIDAGRQSGLLAGDLTRLSHAVNTASKLGERAWLNGDEVGLIVFADSPQTVVSPSRAHLGFGQFRRTLEGVASSKKESNPLPAIQLAKKLLSRRSLVVILTDVDEADMAGQLTRATTLLIPKHLPLIAGIIDPAVVELRDQQANNWLDPYYSYAASMALQSTNGHSRALQRLGAATVLSPPERLDGAVLHSYERLRTQRRI